MRIDADLHNIVPSLAVLKPYLAAHWQEYLAQSRFPGPVDTSYPLGAATSRRPGLPADAATTLADLQEQVLDPLHLDIGLLNCTYEVESLHNPDLATALATAVNRWQLEQWLQPEPRLRGSLVVPSHYPALAVEEIERWGDQPHFVQIFLPVRSHLPYGNRQFWPIYEAAAKHDLVIGLHFGGNPGNPSTPTGWPSRYIEEYVGMTHVFQSQLISLMAEGVFVQFPSLKMTLLESGWSWLPSLMWRLDKEWKGLRREIPWVEEPPSEMIRRHMRFTLQPIDLPNADHLSTILAQMGSDELLLFSTDYPHWHRDDAAQFLAALPTPLQEKIGGDNAHNFYGF